MRTEIIKCDRCGKENEALYNIELPYIIGKHKYVDDVGIEYPNFSSKSNKLCKQCMEELVDWMDKENR